MKRTLFFVSALVALGLGEVFMVSLRSAGSDEPARTAASEKIEALLKKRVETLRQLVSVVSEQYRTGQAGYASVVQASNELSGAELELAKRPDERIAILRRRLETFREFERVVEKLHRGREAAFQDVLTAQAASLQGEIQLLREQAGDK